MLIIALQELTLKTLDNVSEKKGKINILNLLHFKNLLPIYSRNARSVTTVSPRKSSCVCDPNLINHHCSAFNMSLGSRMMPLRTCFWQVTREESTFSLFPFLCFAQAVLVNRRIE